MTTKEISALPINDIAYGHIVWAINPKLGAR
jgi:hypothetical protein